MLMDAATRHAGRTPDHFAFRGVHPVFAGEMTHVMGQRDEDNSMNLCTAVTGDGAAHQGMQAKAVWEDLP
jgi:3-methylfumaryl-CoA hydratase